MGVVWIFSRVKIQTTYSRAVTSTNPLLEIIDYGQQYRGLLKLVGRHDKSAGSVIKAPSKDLWFDGCLAEKFFLAASIFIYCMTDKPESHILIPCGIEQWMRSPKILKDISSKESWNVFATHHWVSKTDVVSDVFCLRQWEWCTIRNFPWDIISEDLRSGFRENARLDRRSWATA